MRKVLFLLAIGPIYLISMLPLGLLYFKSSVLVFFLGRVFGYRRSVVSVNIARAFPNFLYNQIEETTKKFYNNFANIIAENIKSISLSKRGFSRMGHVQNPEVLEKHYRNNTPVIIVGGHMSNWEFLTKMEHFSNGKNLGFDGSHFNFIYKKQSSTVANEIINWTRTSNCKTQLIESNSAARVILKNKEKPACYFLFSDQAPLPGSKFLLSFLNQPTLMINGPEVISRSAGCPVVFLEMFREKKGKYIVRLHEITDNPTACEPGYITTTFAELLEKSIQEHPDNWLWSHKRWKRGVEDNEIHKKVSSPAHNK